MPRIALLIEYNGGKFCGSQYQVGVRTIQAELEKALSTFAREPVSAHFSGRTDSGVHARGQVAHIIWPHDEIDLWRFNWGVNGILPPDVAVVSAQIVPDDFHARFSAVRREYVYRLLNRPQRSALLRDTYYFVPQALDFDKMSTAAAHLVGEHDFKSFKSSNADTGTSVCRIGRAEILNLGEGLHEFWFAANHFVYNMVRIVVGTLLEIGLNKRDPGSISDALTRGNRDLSGPTAPSWGLCLESVQYPEVYGLFADKTLNETQYVDWRSDS